MLMEIPSRWYKLSMQQEVKENCLQRLARIEGQVRGIARMVGEDRYCIDILTQIAAVQAALGKVEREICRTMSTLASSTRSPPEMPRNSAARWPSSWKC